MALEVEIWERDLARNFYPDNTFMTKGKDMTAFVVNGKTVHSPQEGADPNVAVNRATVPATISQRTDADLTWDLSELTTDPTLLRDIEEIETSYDKRNSIISQHGKTLNKKAAGLILNNWAATAAGRVITTTGGEREATAPAATGNRKAVDNKDILKAKSILDLEDVDTEGRYALFSASMYNDLLANDAFIDASRFGAAVIPSGVIGRIHGFWVYMRSHAMIFDTAGSLKALGAAGAADDKESVLFWHEDCVKYAKGNVKIFHNAGEAAYYGDIFSAMARAGGKHSYTDQSGVVSLIQDASV
ncbi:phage capsid protein [Limibacter armeniacum]|uniref:phage capsid protein n=1 Tax=Limibacter armeniacum TaxID=466084 RepID=UPI002FE6104B